MLIFASLVVAGFSRGKFVQERRLESTAQPERYPERIKRLTGRFVAMTQEFKMNRAALRAIAILLTAVTITALPVANCSLRAENQRTEDRFVGAWRLVWLEEPGADGDVHRADCTGLLIYTRDGHMSVQVMYRNLEAGGQAGQVQYAQGGYEASFGTYQISKDGGTFTFHVEGAMVRSLIGKNLPRAFELSGNQLIVRSTNPAERWRVAWEHY